MLHICIYITDVRKEHILVLYLYLLQGLSALGGGELVVGILRDRARTEAERREAAGVLAQVRIYISIYLPISYILQQEGEDLPPLSEPQDHT